MPQGAAHSGDKRAGGNPNGGDHNGGVGPHGGRSGGGVGSATPGGWGFGGNSGFSPGSKSIQGTRNTLHNIATRPGTLSNIATALGMGLGFGPGTAAGLIGGQALGYDPYSGPTGTGTMVEHDPTNNGGLYAQQNQGLRSAFNSFLRPNAGQPKPLPGLMAQTAPQPATPAPTAAPFSLQDLIAQANSQGVPQVRPGASAVALSGRTDTEDRMIQVIPTDQIGIMWRHLQPWLESPIAMSNGRFTPESVYEGLLRGEFQAVFSHQRGVVDAAAITHLSEYGTGALWCDVPLMGGQDMAAWVAPGMGAIEAWAAYNNCRGVQPAGRPGLEKHLAPLGYVPLARVWQKDLSNA